MKVTVQPVSPPGYTAAGRPKASASPVTAPFHASPGMALRHMPLASWCTGSPIRSSVLAGSMARWARANSPVTA